MAFLGSLGLSWASLGSLGLSWGSLGLSWGPPALGFDWPPQERNFNTKIMLSAPGALLGSPGLSWALLGLSWGFPVLSCGVPGALLGSPGARLGSVLAGLPKNVISIRNMFSETFFGCSWGGAQGRLFWEFPWGSPGLSWGSPGLC